MKRAIQLSLCVSVWLGALGCSGLKQAYGREYVLYDGSKAGPAPAEVAERRTALDAELARLDRAIRAGEDHDGALAARRAAAEKELLELERVVSTAALERELAELDRAIRAGEDADGALARRRAELERELVAARTAAGASR
jgi:hypothetical protein